MGLQIGNQMNLTTPRGRGPLSTAIRQLNQSVTSLRPGRAPGVLTRHTPGGVLRQADPGVAAKKGKTTARWA